METKIVLNLVVPGAGTVEVDNLHKEKLSKKNRKKRKIRGNLSKEALQEVEKKQKTVAQNINMCREAYYYMVCTPISNKYNRVVATKGGGLAKLWETMNEEAKLRLYFDSIAHDLGAISYTFTVFE